MRTRFEIVAMGEGRFGAQITEGDVTSSHQVVVPDDLLVELGHDVGDVAAERVVREALAFLMERIPATAIPGEVSLADVASEHTEFDEELRARLAAVTQ